MRAIFVSYRRDDSEGEAGRLFDDLVQRFGDDSVFMDVAAIQAGRDFRKAIDESVASCGVLLSVIGKNWVDAKNEAGERRLDDPSDFVRLETASALKRDIPVIPVLVHGATMPRPDQLPDDLKDLAYRNCCELTHARWNSDLQLLIKALGAYVEAPEKSGGPAPQRALAGAAVPQPSSSVPHEPSEVRSAAIPQPSWWKSRGAIIVVILVAAAALGLAAYKLLSPEVKPQRSGSDTAGPASIEVPALVGMPLGAARRILREQHLRVGTLSREPKADVAENTVLDEFPKQGRKVDAGTAVDLVVSDVSTKPNAPTLPRR